MRKLLLCSSLLIALSLYSQEWAPINSTEKFCYSTDENLDIIDAVLWVDSLEIIGNDSVFHLNKIARPVMDQGFQYLFNEPQFLLDDVIVKNNGEWIFIDTSFNDLDVADTFRILPKANYYESWEFSSDLDAVVANVSTMPIFGQTDSVKIILLSDFTMITLSKNHGIINWKNQYELVGIEGRDLGIQVPNFDDMYAFLSSGDVICVDANTWDAGAGVVELFVKIRYDIDTVIRYQDSIFVEAAIRTDKTYIYWNGDIINDLSMDRQGLLLKRSRETDAYPNEPVFLYINDYYAWGYGLTIYKLDEFKWGGVKKTQVTHEGEHPYSNLYYECEGDYSFELCEVWDETVLKEHSARFGFLEYYNGAFERGGTREIIGVIDDGDTTGTIYPMSIFVGTHGAVSNSNWIIYPNPAQDFITIQTTDNQSNIDYKLYSLNGIILKEGILSSKESIISIKKLPKGMYFIELIINGEKTTKKWIKN